MLGQFCRCVDQLSAAIRFRPDVRDVFDKKPFLGYKLSFVFCSRPVRMPQGFSFFDSMCFSGKNELITWTIRFFMKIAFILEE